MCALMSPLQSRYWNITTMLNYEKRKNFELNIHHVMYDNRCICLSDGFPVLDIRQKESSTFYCLMGNNADVVNCYRFKINNLI